MRNKVLPFLAIFLLFTATSYAQSQRPAAGRVRGTVFDSNTAVVPNAKVVFEAAGTTHAAVTNGEGQYDIELPVGAYRVTTKVAGFCTFERASFRVQRSSNALINVTLTVCGLANILHFNKERKYDSEECRYVDPLQNDVLPLTKIPNGPQGDLVIRYRQRQQTKGVVEYGGGEPTNGVPSGVTVTYDVLTMRADKVTLNKKSLRLEAEGNVKIEDGKQATYYATAAIDLKASDPRTTLVGKQ